MTASAASTRLCVTCAAYGVSIDAVEGYLCAEHAERARGVGFDPATGQFGSQVDTRNKELGHKDKVSSEGRGGLSVVPSAPSGKLERVEPELRGLIRDHEQGFLEPMAVELGDLPAVGARATCFDGRLTVVTEAMHLVAADIRLLLGLRLAVNEDRPLPYSTRFCAERCRLRDHRQASRVLRSLEAAGVVTVAGKMKPRGQPFGTKLYEAP